MAPSSLTLQYDSILSTTLFNYKRTVEDNISKINALMYQLMKLDPAGYQKEQVNGDRMMMPLMYEIGQADSYSGYDVLDVTPMDGMTACFWDWAQASVPIAISGKEEKLNRGEAQITNLLKAKTMQAEMGIQAFFNYRILCGAGGTSITTTYTSPANGSSFVDPLPKVIAYAPTGSVAIGNINQYTHSWWRNQTSTQSATTFAGFLKELKKLRMKCGRGPGGYPNLHLVDEDTYSLYDQALAAKHQNTSYVKADIPFENIAFYGKPVTADEVTPDVATGSETQSETSGSWFMINSKFFGFKVDSETDFAPTPFVKPENQDAKVSHILWFGGFGCSNRRKQGVMGSIDTTIAA
jgi:hypothetical protein